MLTQYLVQMSRQQEISLMHCIPRYGVHQWNAGDPIQVVIGILQE